MKKMISATLLATAIALATAGAATAQTGDKDITFIPANHHAAYVDFVLKTFADDTAAASTSSAASKADLKAIKANTKALKYFNAFYKKDMPDVKWSVSKDAMVAYFSKDNVKTDVVYNNKGAWLHTLTYYPADKTPADIADMMYYAYPRDEVKLTVRVEEGNMVFHIVQLEGKTTFKKVTVYDGEVNTMEEFTKSN